MKKRLKKRFKTKMEWRKHKKEVRRLLMVAETLTDHCTCELMKQLTYNPTLCLMGTTINNNARWVRCSRRKDHKGNHVACIHTDSGVEEYAFKHPELPF